jgi:hypothetical protein
MRGVEDDDAPLEWSADGKYVYVGVQYPDHGIWRVEVNGGNRQLWKRINPADAVGALEIFPTSITPDGKSFAVQYDRSLDQLYTVEGLN